MTNVARHSDAEKISVSFDWKEPVLRLLIRDDGVGFKASEVRERPSKHLGIEGMRQRASMMGGTFHIQSELDKGTLIEVQLTLSEQKKQPASIGRLIN